MSELKLEQGDACPQCEYGIISSFECGLGCGNCGFIVNKPEYKKGSQCPICRKGVFLFEENGHCICGIIKNPPCPACENKYLECNICGTRPEEIEEIEITAGNLIENNYEINLEEFIIKKTEEKSKEIMDSKIKKVINDKLIKDDKEKSADCHDDTFDALSYAMDSFNIYKKESADVLCYDSYILFDAINKTEDYCWLNWYAMKRDC